MKSKCNIIVNTEFGKITGTENCIPVIPRQSLSTSDAAELTPGGEGGVSLPLSFELQQSLGHVYTPPNKINIYVSHKDLG